MISRTCVFFATVLLFCGATGIGRAQEGSASTSSSQSQSLGDAARKARAQKKESDKPAKVFTNEDLGGLRGTISVVGSEAAPAPAGGTGAAADKTKTPKEDAKKTGTGDEAAWRAKFAAARKTLAQDEKELDILQREFNLKQQQFYQDPTAAMKEQHSRDDLNKTQSEIDAKKQDVEKDKHALSDLEDELRRAGGEPGWANESSGAGPSDSSGSNSGNPNSATTARP